MPYCRCLEGDAPSSGQEAMSGYLLVLEEMYQSSRMPSTAPLLLDLLVLIHSSWFWECRRDRL